jgi:hypothetical protein
LQLLGLAASVVVLELLQRGGSPNAVVPVWAAIHGLHAWLRYTSLKALRFPWPNQARCRAAQAVAAACP